MGTKKIYFYAFILVAILGLVPAITKTIAKDFNSFQVLLVTTFFAFITLFLINLK